VTGASTQIPRGSFRHSPRPFSRHPTFTASRSKCTGPHNIFHKSAPMLLISVGLCVYDLNDWRFRKIDIHYNRVMLVLINKTKLLQAVNTFVQLIIFLWRAVRV